MKLSWYWQRLRRMDVQEVRWRARDAVLRQTWRRRLGKPAPRRIPAAKPRFATGGWRPIDKAPLPPAAVKRLTSAAQAVLAGQWLVFGRKHPQFGAEPDWFVDPDTGRHAPADQYAFDIPYRDQSKIGNIKFIWEPSRHHHLTMLAAAYAATGDCDYAKRIEAHLRSWWRKNPFLCGPHWISGIEIGIRLISWVWVRRLLQDWPGAADLFEVNPDFVNQLYRHQQWLAAFPSRGSSANNHLVAEAAGQFVAACAFPLFGESARWRDEAAHALRNEAVAQTFPSGLNRELATDYQGLVLELFLSAAIEGEIGGFPLGPVVWERIRAMLDALAAVIDAKGHPPRQGDGDDGIGLLLDAPDYHRWNALLATGRRLFGALDWWPDRPVDDVRTALWTQGIEVPPLPQGRPVTRPNLLADAGHAYLRQGKGREEIWCRCDHGPHGFLSIAAHAHADALSLELRVGGTEVLADPGTYCYHGEPEWRRYFRSTVGHNTLELMGQDQSVSGGPFLWTQQAQAKLIHADGLDEGAPQATWCAEHAGYVARGGPVHRRTVTLDRTQRALTIRDEVIGKGGETTPARLAFHLGPSVACTLESRTATLSWPGGEAVMELPETLSWTLHSGGEQPPLGWYSPSFGNKISSPTLLGTGSVQEGTPLISRLHITLKM